MTTTLIPAAFIPAAFIPAALTPAVPLAPPGSSPVDWCRVRRSARNVVGAVIVGIGIVLLARQAPTLGRALVSVTQANPFGLLLTALFGAVTYAAAAVAITAASGRPLPFGRTVAVQLAAACTNRVAPAGLGGMATNVRFLERDGATRSQAVTAIGVTSIASFVVHTLATIAALAFVRQPVAALAVALPLPSGIPLTVVLFVAIVAVGLTANLLRRFGPRITMSLREGWVTATTLCADPRRLARLVLGTVGVTLGHGLAFAAAVTACGVNLPILGLLAVFLAGSAIGSTAPTPGGLGALEGALVAGLTGLGAAFAPAVAGVLTYRLITYWLPIVPGAVALKVLRRDTLAPA